MDFERLTEDVCSICRETGNWILNEAEGFNRSEVETKGKQNFVTYVDKESERMLVENFRKIIPGSNILAEEGDYSETSSEYKWIIDPLDGTTNFIHGIPLYSISVALALDGRIVSGVIYDVPSDECFYASPGRNARMNNKNISVSETGNLENSMLATGFPYELGERFEAYLSLFRDMVNSSRGMRRLGSAAIDLAYVACGRFDGFYEYRLNPWDVAAGAFIVSRAGGMVTDFKGGDDYIYGNQLIASNGKNHNEILQIINRYFD